MVEHDLVVTFAQVLVDDGKIDVADAVVDDHYQRNLMCGLNEQIYGP